MPQLLKQVPLILEDADNGLSTFARELAHDLYEEIRQQIQRIEALDRRLKQWIPQQPEAELLLTIPGYGPVIVTALLAAIGNGSQFKQGR